MEKHYHYTECGLENVFLLGGVRHEDTPRGRIVVIEDIDGLHSAIGCFLIHEKKNLNGREFRFLRHEMGLSQSNLALLLGVDEQSVARWEKGDTKKFAPAEKLVRMLYEEHLGGNEKVSDLLTKLSELDDLLEEEMRFADTEIGWQHANVA